MQPPSEFAPSYRPPPPPPNKGFPTWLVVLLSVGVGVVVLGGIMAALAITGVRRYIANAKQVEARNSLSQIARDAAEAYEHDSLSPGKPVGLCASASRSVPASASKVRGVKYQSDPSEWEVDSAEPRTGFACLHFEMAEPQYYMYSYTAHGVKAPGDGFTATANGDLDGDGVLSTFTVSGKVEPGATLTVEPNIVETHPEE
jgi:type IV pilus assembly protein PilA